MLIPSTPFSAMSAAFTVAVMPASSTTWPALRSGPDGGRPAVGDCEGIDGDVWGAGALVWGGGALETGPRSSVRSQPARPASVAAAAIAARVRSFMGAPFAGKARAGVPLARAWVGLLAALATRATAARVVARLVGGARIGGARATLLLAAGNHVRLDVRLVARMLVRIGLRSGRATRSRRIASRVLLLLTVARLVAGLSGLSRVLLRLLLVRHSLLLI